MTEEFDEEVVFENSPLFQYLQDLGHSDFQACAAVSREEEEGRADRGEGPLPQDTPTPLRGGLFRRLADAALGQLHKGAMSDRMEQRLDAEFRQYSLSALLKQDVLLQEDVELIELLDPSILSAESPSSSSAALPTARSLGVPSAWDLSVLAAFVAVLAGVATAGEGPGPAALVPWVLALLGFVLARGAGLWRAARLRGAMRARGALLEGLAQDSRALTGLARRALRLIQETEVISRGFTLVSAACPLNKAGKQRGQQLLGLRKASYRALRAAFRASRLATCHMLKSYPLNSEIDNVTNYVSTVPLKDLGLGLGEEHLTDEQTQDLTDDYSLPALKVLFQLWAGQSSEFFRRLALLLSPRQGVGRGDGGGGAARGTGRDTRLAHEAVAEVTAPLQRALSGCLCELQRSYDFHRYFEMQHQPQGSDRVGRARQKCCELNALHTSVRSLQLHLKALLNEVIILEDELEKLMVSQKTAEMTCAEYRELQGRLRLLQPHMQASAGCWDETVAQVERMLQRAANCPGTPETPDAPPLPSPQPHPVARIQDRDPVPEEQELEAYVSDSDSDSGWPGPLLDLLSPEERERQQRERDESRGVLLELKSVLGLRTSEAERQKRKQLLFSERAALKPPEPHRTPDPPEPQGEQSNHVAGQPDGERAGLCCGQSGGGRDTSPTPAADGAGETVRYQRDGTAGEGEGENGTRCPPVGGVPAPSVTDGLTGLHGSDGLTFGSTLAAQAATRSHSFPRVGEHTFVDGEEVERRGKEEKEEVTS
ncbi:vezatin-like [Megalops cyprinoides]|uniref:vezatin-like n=1 Tax=Megalops cyprinoides TaxID=118141 RepID=UPI001863FFC9|nr:vezatin-like [Megalops cyprinoides]